MKFGIATMAGCTMPAQNTDPAIGLNLMLMSNPPEATGSRSASNRQNSFSPSPGSSLALGLLGFLLLALATPLSTAQSASAQRAIEKLESCSKEERKQGCVQILKQRKAGDKLLAVKAQIRGGRIIWYEYNKKSGKVRRTN